MNEKKGRGLSQNQLKMIAAASMVVDHLGVQIFPQYLILRIVGRLAFPLFAYFVYEGAKYTHRPSRYLGRMAAMGILCVAGYGVFAGELFGNILITFTLSLAILFALQEVERRAREKASFWGSLALTALLIGGIAWLCSVVTVDYGFLGVLLPVFAHLGARLAPEPKWERAGSLAGFCLGLVLLCGNLGWVQWYSLAALPFLLVYSGKRGSWNLQGFFYWFYPVHLVLIYLLSLLIP